MTEKDLWICLREQVDRLGAGFYATESGVEIKLLKRLFSEEEAKVFIALDNRTEPLPVIAKRLSRNPSEVQPILDGMAVKAIVARIPTDPPSYFPLPYIPGFGEWAAMLGSYKANDKETAELADQYLNVALERLKYPILRPIPVMESINAKPSSVASYDDVKRAVNEAERIAVVPCPCDALHRAMGRETVEPLERCLTLGPDSDVMVQGGFGRYITREECMKILDECEEKGFIPQVGPVDPIRNICNCGKSCFEINQKKLHARPVEWSDSNYYAVIDGDLCTGCATCVGRCVMEAITISMNDIAEINLDRCLGCGLCVTKCPAKALSLMEKKEAQQFKPSDINWSVKSQKEVMAELAPYKNMFKTPSEHKPGGTE